MNDDFIKCLEEESKKQVIELIRKINDAYDFASARKLEAIAVQFDTIELLLLLPMLRNKLEKTDAKPERASCKPYNELEATVPLMLNDDYKARFVAEYRQTKYRYERLKAFCNRIEAAKITPERDEIEEPKHDCPLELLRAQQRAMGEYLHTLEIRAVIERIEL